MSSSLCDFKELLDCIILTSYVTEKTMLITKYGWTLPGELCVA